jgi:heterodisulfide reductase subunit B
MRIAFFPGCVIPVRYPRIEAATRAVAGRLGIELVDMGFHCCPAPTVLKEASVDASLVLAVHNLCMAEAEELDVVTICSGCANTLREARHACREDEAKRQMVQRILAAHGKEYRGMAQVFQLPDLLARDEYLDRMEAQSVRSLEGLRIATHYGCHYFRPSSFMRDNGWDPEYPLPESMELILEALGAEIVEYERQDLCCGAALGYNAGKGDESLEILAEKLKWIQEAAAQAIVVACPSCMTQFDTGQVLLRRKATGLSALPVYHIAELVAFALGSPLCKPAAGGAGMRNPLR